MTIALWFTARMRSFVHAGRGLSRLLSEPNFRIHLVLLGCALALGVWLRIGAGEWACTLLAAALVLMAEAFNTALESLADAVIPQRHPLIGVAKDVAATAVLLSAIGALAVAVCVFFPKIWLRLG